MLALRGGASPTPPRVENRPIEQLAALYGVEASYYDIQGRLHVASDDALIAMMECLGRTVTQQSTVTDLIRARQTELAERLLPPVVVRWSPASGISVRVRHREAAGRVEVRIELEDGRTIELAVALSNAKLVRRIDAGEKEYADFDLAIPEPLPVGYHRVEARLGARSAKAALWVAPERAFDSDGAPGWGLFTPTYALRSARNEGVGEFADL